MTHDKTGGPAFPAQPKYEHPGGGYIVHDQGGMTLRDYFAGQALVGLLAGKHGEEWVDWNAVEDAYEMADAMLREREGTTND